MTLQIRLKRLENYQSMNIPVMPEGLTPVEQYLWLVRQQPAPKTPMTKIYGLSPEGSYAWMVAA